MENDLCGEEIEAGRTWCSLPPGHSGPHDALGRARLRGALEPQPSDGPAPIYGTTDPAVPSEKPKP